MKILFIGTVELSRALLERLIGLKAYIAGVITKERSDFNTDFADLSIIAKSNNIPCRYVTDINSAADIKWIRGLNADIIFCFGFSHIIKKDVLESARLGVVGFHPARLPRNRGRHPVVWALVLGLPRTASTFFFMDEGVDSGAILSQEEIEISYDDDARSLYDKVTRAAMRQMEEFLPQLEDGTFKRVAQDLTGVNYWPKRCRDDGRIDFKMPSRVVYNLVRGLTRPYAGAHLSYKSREIKIWKAKEAPEGSGNIEGGRVLDIRDNNVLVKCGTNAVLLTGHEFRELPKKGESLS